MLCSLYSLSNLLDFPWALRQLLTWESSESSCVPVKLICMLSHAGEGKEYIHLLSCSVTRMLEEECRQKELVLLRWKGWYHAVTFPWCSSWIVSLISPWRCCFSESLKSVPFPPLHFQWDFEVTISQGHFFNDQNKSCCSGSLGWCSQLMSENRHGSLWGPGWDLEQI